MNFRVIHRKDTVPHSPPMMFFYVHSGYELWYKDGMEAPFFACRGDSDQPPKLQVPPSNEQSYISTGEFQRISEAVVNVRLCCKM